mmetsp:Transcript_30569/g.46304  ORF Transcript_30569/g.46304 Transcript_30569/m.46304 type:complete len:181 (-) Transcript_30569:104-646(-)
MAGRRITSATSPTEKQAKPSDQTGRPNRRQQSRNNTNNNFNPKLISSQIVALQCFHYLILGLIFQLDHYVFGTSVTIDRIFTDAYLSVWSWIGWIDSSAILISYLFGAVLLAIIVEKSKKCLDFSVTLFLIHLFSCVWYAGMPSQLDWWIVHILGTIVMILLGEYLCSLKELSDIPLLDL